MASPVVGTRSRPETRSSTIQEEEEEEDDEEEEEEKKGNGHDKQFLKTNSLASLLPRYFEPVKQHVAISREIIWEKIRRKRVGNSQVPWVATSISGVQPISLYATLHMYFLPVYKIFSQNISLYATPHIYFLAVYKIFSQNISL